MQTGGGGEHFCFPSPILRYGGRMNSKLAALTIVLSMVVVVSAVAIGSDDTDGSTTQVTDENGLTSAINSANNGDVIQLSDDIELTTTLTIPVGKTITLDLNTHTLKDSTNHSGALIKNNGNLTVSGNGAMNASNSSASTSVILNYGTLTIENGTFTGNSGGSRAVINNTTLQSTISGTPTVTINGGTFSGGACAVNNYTGCTVTITGGEFTNSGNLMSCIQNQGTMEISNAEMNTQSTGYSLINNTGNLTINSGTYTSQNIATVLNGSGTGSSEATLKINGGTFSAQNASAVINYGTTVTITGGTFSNTSCAGCGGAAYVLTNSNSAGTATLNIGLTGTAAINVHGSFGAVNNSGGVLNIGRGSFEVDAPSCVNGHTTTYYAVYNAGNNAEVSATISGGSFVSQNTYVICNGNSTDGNLMKKSSIKISDGEFTINDNSSNLTAILIDSGVETASEITGGKFSAPLPDNATIPSGMTKGIDGDGNTIVGEPITITVTINGETADTFTTVSGGTLKDDLEGVVPTDTDGYLLSFGGYETRDDLIDATFTGTTTIAITKSLDSPTVEITGNLNPAYGEKTTLTAECIHEATVEISYTYQWYKDGNAIPGETAKTLVTGESGAYSVYVTASDGKLTSAEVKPDAITVTVGDPTYHTVSFMVDGESIKDVQVIDGRSVQTTDYPENPTKTGYTFVKWVDADGEVPDLSNITSNVSVYAVFELNAPTSVSVVLSGPLYEGESITATVSAEHELDSMGFVYVMVSYQSEEPIVSETGVFTITEPGNYIFAALATDGVNYSNEPASETMTIAYSERPYVPPITDDDDDYVPIVPVVPDQSSGDDNTVTIVACAAAAVVAALMAVFLIIERRK